MLDQNRELLLGRDGTNEHAAEAKSQIINLLISVQFEMKHDPATTVIVDELQKIFLQNINLTLDSSKANKVDSLVRLLD